MSNLLETVDEGTLPAFALFRQRTRTPERQPIQLLRVPHEQAPEYLFEDLAITDTNELIVFLNDLTALDRAWLLQFETVPNRQTQHSRDYDDSYAHCRTFFFVVLKELAVRALGLRLLSPLSRSHEP